MTSTTVSIEFEPASTSMRPRELRFGLSCALVTPFTPQGTVDRARLLVHIRRCLSSGCESVTLFGTTGEGASVGLDERAATLEALADAGLDLSRELLAGVAATSVADAAAQANQLFAVGGRGVLLAPPFYFKESSDEGLFRWFASVLDRCAAPRGVILYHIPDLTGAPLSSALVHRIDGAFPGVITGIKDSTGAWTSARRFIAEHPHLDVLIGDERLLAGAMRRGASGAISGFANFCAGPMRAIVDEGVEIPGIAELVSLALQYPIVPAVKALVAHRWRDDSFVATAPPLEPADPDARRVLGAALDRLFASA